MNPRQEVEEEAWAEPWLFSRCPHRGPLVLHGSPGWGRCQGPCTPCARVPLPPSVHRTSPPRRRSQRRQDAREHFEKPVFPFLAGWVKVGRRARGHAVVAAICPQLPENSA